MKTNTKNDVVCHCCKIKPALPMWKKRRKKLKCTEQGLLLSHVYVWFALLYWCSYDASIVIVHAGADAQGELVYLARTLDKTTLLPIDNITACSQSNIGFNTILKPSLFSSMTSYFKIYGSNQTFQRFLQAPSPPNNRSTNISIAPMPTTVVPQSSIVTEPTFHTSSSVMPSSSSTQVSSDEISDITTSKPSLRNSPKPTTSVEPSAQPSDEPSSGPTQSSAPSTKPSATNRPSFVPSYQPSAIPSLSASVMPTLQPSQQPSPRYQASAFRTIVMVLVGMSANLSMVRGRWGTLTSVHVQSFWNNDLLSSPAFIQSVQTVFIDQTDILITEPLKESNSSFVTVTNATNIMYSQLINYSIVPGSPWDTPLSDSDLIEDLIRELFSLPFDQNSLPYTNEMVLITNGTRPIILSSITVRDVPTRAPTRSFAPIQTNRNAIITGVVSVVAALLLLTACSIIYLVHFKKPAVHFVSSNQESPKSDDVLSPNTWNPENDNFLAENDALADTGSDRLNQTYEPAEIGTMNITDISNLGEPELNPKLPAQHASSLIGEDTVPETETRIPQDSPDDFQWRGYDNQAPSRISTEADTNPFYAAQTRGPATAFRVNNAEVDMAFVGPLDEPETIEYRSDESNRSSSIGSGSQNGTGSKDPDLMLTPTSAYVQQKQSMDSDSSEHWTPYMANFQMDIQDLE